MTIVRTSAWTLAVPGVVHDFVVLDATVTLDDRFSIYCQATVTVAAVPDAVLADLDPRSWALRATLTASQEILAPAPSAPPDRVFDLFIHERRRNDDDTVTLQLASDEAILELRGLVDDVRTDYAAYPYEDTVRDVVDRVLDDYSLAALEAGSVDASVARTHARVNLLTNPSFETNTTSWAALINAGTITRVATVVPGVVGGYALRWTAPGSGLSAMISAAVPVSEGRWVQGLVVINSTVSRDAEVRIYYYDAAGAQISIAQGGYIATMPGQFMLLNIFDQAPEGAVTAKLAVMTTGNAAGNQHFIDGCLLEEIPEEVTRTGLVPYQFQSGGSYFDGANSPDPTYYTAAWTGTAHASSSTLTPLDDRGFDLLLMRPGQTVAAFFRPIVELTGGRLFCDEQRDWRLVDDIYTVAGTVTAAIASSVTGIEDVISLSASEDGQALTFTGVVLEYTYTDRNAGTTTTVWDVAGDNSGRVYTRQIDGAYPGPGAAAAILARAAGRGHVISFTALSDHAATPGMALELTAADGAYEGVVSRVQWRWGAGSDTDTMEITPRELVPA